MRYRARYRAGILLLLLLFPATQACLFAGRQRYKHLSTPTPIGEGDVLVVGFMGGRERWNNDRNSVRKLAPKLIGGNGPSVRVETVENNRRHLALRLIRESLDRNGDGSLDASERDSARLIIYGQSFGGAAVVKLARRLKEMDIPVLLTVQIDSVGRGDRVIPSNVARAANLFQRNGRFIKGEPEIKAEDPTKTEIIGNFEFDYGNREVDLSGVSWFKTVFRRAHAKMEYDPEVWSKVGELIVNELNCVRNR